MAGPLGHIRVLELSRILAGPWASQTLADLGASVIKVERPGVGDDTRTWGPPFVKRGEQGDGAGTTDAAYFLCTNRGKRSITVDFTKPEGQEIVNQLAQSSDVLIENFKPGGLERYGLDYESLKKLNHRLVYCSITGFGQTGPYHNRPGYDFLIQGMGGLMSVTGQPDDEPGGEPMKVGLAVADLFTGLYAVIAIQGALAHVELKGEGQYIDLALLDVQLAVMANQASNYLATGTPPGRLGNAHPNIVPYHAFATSDGFVILAVGNDAQFARFCEVAGQPELATDERYVTNSLRVKNREELLPVLQTIFCDRSSLQWIGDLEAVGVPCGPINSMGAVFDDPQIRSRGMQIEIEDDVTGTTPGVASPIKYSKTPLSHTQAPPSLGQHTDEILREVHGYTQAEIDGLRTKGVI